MAKTQILVVEDEVIVAEDIRRSLQNMGYSVPVTVSRGEDAIKKAAENNPDLVLMDIVIQGEMDGIQTAEQICSRFNIPVVYLTAFSDKKTLERAKITEPFGYVIKPFKERELNITIEIALYKHRMEEKLRESREWFTTTLKSISDAVIATDPGGCVKFMNPVAQSMTGWAPEEAYSKPLRDVFNIMSEKGNKKSGEGTAGNRTLLIARSMARIPLEINSDPIRNEKGEITGIVTVFRDITERKKDEGKIAGLKDFYECVLESIVTGVWVTDKNDIITYANKGAGIIFAQKVAGMNVLKDFPEFFRPYYLKARETMQQFYYEAVPPGGSQRYCSGWLIPRIKDGSFNGMICTVESIPGHEVAEQGGKGLFL